MEERLQQVCAKLIVARHKHAVLRKLIRELINKDCIDNEGKIIVNEALAEINKL